MKERKRKLRKQIAKEKSRHTDSTLKDLSNEILERLEAHPTFQSAHTILLYFSLGDEVHTHTFIEKWSTRKRILLPVVKGDELELRFYTNAHTLKTGTYNIQEPTGDPFEDYPSIDLAIIPGVAFDEAGHRLGRGKGYYDKLLPEISAYKIGICFPFQCVDEVPAEEFDIPMDEIISRT